MARTYAPRDEKNVMAVVVRGVVHVVECGSFEAVGDERIVFVAELHERGAIIPRTLPLELP